MKAKFTKTPNKAKIKKKWAKIAQYGQLYSFAAFLDPSAKREGWQKNEVYYYHYCCKHSLFIAFETQIRFCINIKIICKNYNVFATFNNKNWVKMVLLNLVKGGRYVVIKVNPLSFTVFVTLSSEKEKVDCIIIRIDILSFTEVEA